MFEDRLGEHLRKDLDGPKLAAPHPTQARYRLNTPVARYPVGGMLRVGGAFVAGAIVAAALLSAETGSTNPRVWTVRVASALSQLTEPAPPTATPASQPTPLGGEGTKGGNSQGGLLVVSADGRDHDSAQGVSPSRGGDDVNRTPTPTGSPDDHESSGSGGSGGSSGPTPDPHRDGSPEAMPTPTATPEPEH
jgi:hypothetical protein